MKTLIRILLCSLVFTASVFAGSGAPPAAGNYSGKITVTTASTWGASVTLKTSQMIKAHYEPGPPSAVRIFYRAIPRLGAIDSQPFDYVKIQVDGTGTGTAQIQVGSSLYNGSATTTNRSIKLSFTGGVDPNWFYEIALTRLSK